MFKYNTQSSNYNRITTMLNLATSDIRKYSKFQQFSATFVAVFTWEDMLPKRYLTYRDNVNTNNLFILR